MANKPISRLPAASQVDDADLLVLEQGGVAKKYSGQLLRLWLLAMADGHGGISDIQYTAPVPPSLTGEMRIILADGTVSTVSVQHGRGISSLSWAESGTPGDGKTHTGTFAYNDGTTSTLVLQDGVKGDKGDNTYLWIKYAGVEPTSDADVGDNPDDWIGIYTGESSTAPTSYLAYTWFKIKGETGETGAGIGSVVLTSQSGLVDTYTIYTDDDPPVAVGTFTVTNGAGSLSTVDGAASSGNGNVVHTLALSDTITALPHTITDARIKASMVVIECTFGTPSAITSDVAWTTSDGDIVLSGTMSGSTTVSLVLSVATT